MNYETEYKLKLFRDIQPSLFDEKGKAYRGTRVSNSQLEQMLELINCLETEANMNEPTDEQ